jgi:hypothetical protein
MNLRVIGVVSTLLSILAPLANAAPARPAPALPAPPGAVVHVSSEIQLRAAVAALTSNTTIEIAAGTYVLRDAL